MKNNTKLAYAALVVFASSAYAADDAPKFNGKGKASVEVRNTLDIVETASLNFGTIAAVAGKDGTLATLELNPESGKLKADNGEADNAGRITPIDETGVSQGIFTVSNAAKFTDLNVKLPEGSIDMTMDSPPPGALKFTLDTFKAFANDSLVDFTNGVGQATTDENGNLVLFVGATLKTQQVSDVDTKPYIDAEYTGEYAVTISY